jgi:hypothetical protein
VQLIAAHGWGGSQSRLLVASQGRLEVDLITLETLGIGSEEEAGQHQRGCKEEGHEAEEHREEMGRGAHEARRRFKVREAAWGLAVTTLLSHRLAWDENTATALDDASSYERNR